MIENAMVLDGFWSDGNEEARHEARREARQAARDAMADATEDEHKAVATPHDNILDAFDVQIKRMETLNDELLRLTRMLKGP